MMRMKILGVFLLVGLCETVDARERLTLDQAVGLALGQNRSLRVASHDRESAEWGVLKAYSNFLPKIEVLSSLTRIDPASERRANSAIDFIKSVAGPLGIPPSALSDVKPFAYRDTYGTDITVVQPVYNGGAEIAGVHAASALREKNDYVYQDIQQDVVASVKTTYMSVLKAQELVTLAKESAERTRHYLDMTRRRAAVGMRTQTDVLRWEVQLAADGGGVINAENYLAMMRLQLNEVMGVELEREYALDADLSPDSLLAVDRSQPAHPVFASAGEQESAGGLNPAFLDMHPTMRVMEANLRLADVNIERSWANFKPKVNVAFQYGWEKNNTLALDGIKPWALSLSLSVPLFNGFGDYTNLQKARADYKSAEIQAESARRSLLLQATNASLNVMAAHKRIDIARKGLEHALEVLNSLTRRYESGGASNVDLIDVQTAYTSAKTDYIAALYDHAIAEVQLSRATGTLTR
jgi:outer membrane protein